jgi:thiol-disulfide isomerase/thioredoxin/TolA-binding protein
MRTSWAIRASLVLAFGFVASIAARAADRPADKILAEIEAIQIPAESKVPAEIAKRQKVVEQKSKLILELYKAHPTNPELVRLMPERWASRPPSSAAQSTTRAEVEEILQKNKNPKLVAEAAYYKAVLAIRRAGDPPKIAVAMPAIDEFAKRCPDDERSAQLLYQLASAQSDRNKKAELFAKIQKDFPESPAAKKVEALAKVTTIPANRDEMIGKPFALSFTDAIKGSEVSIDSLKGKVVVIDFWATWCGPCVAEMPKMKKLYAEFKDKGVEFIGVSLDQSKAQGGLDSLKAFVAKNGIEWPQYFQGNYWQSEFSASWHVNSIPCVFLIDADGNLASTNARGKLESLIPEYLAKAKSKKTASR